MSRLDNLPTEIIDLIKYYMIVQESERRNYFVVVQDTIIRDLSSLTIYDMAYLNIINGANKTILKKMCKPLKIKQDKVEYFMRVSLMEHRLNRKFGIFDHVRDYWIRSGKGDKKKKIVREPESDDDEEDLRLFDPFN